MNLAIEQRILSHNQRRTFVRERRDKTAAGIDRRAIRSFRMCSDDDKRDYDAEYIEYELVTQNHNRDRTKPSSARGFLFVCSRVARRSRTEFANYDQQVGNGWTMFASCSWPDGFAVNVRRRVWGRGTERTATDSDDDDDVRRVCFGVCGRHVNARCIATRHRADRTCLHITTY